MNFKNVTRIIEYFLYPFEVGTFKTNPIINITSTYLYEERRTMITIKDIDNTH